ncbi:N-acetylglucosamine kinase [Paenibacillus sp. GCM10027626]|uniref:N-acetylglucosamine kinase n=1 Tax=Paenibacillus sp. GCM10027626 TaxID=3273411 RepID=UPI00364275E7
MSRIIMSIESGGSKTLCLLQTAEGELLGWGLGGPTHHLKLEEAASSFQQAIKMAMEGSGVAGAQVSLIFSSQLGQFDALQTALGRVGLEKEFVYIDDPTVTLFGALCRDWGVVALSGTGSFVYGRNREGRCLRVGGLGDLLGDDGSGFDVGLSGLRAALRYLGGWEQQTMLAEEICKEWNLSEFDATDVFLNSSTQNIMGKVLQALPDNYRHLIAKLSRVVARCAYQGDAVSQAIIHQAGKKLAEQVVAVCNRIEMGDDPIPVGYAGGCWRIGDMLIEAFQEALQIRMTKSFRTIPQMLEPAFGVYLAALKHMNKPWENTLLSRLRQDNEVVKKAIST